jgi:uncharacterized Zn-finger protein
MYLLSQKLCCLVLLLFALRPFFFLLFFFLPPPPPFLLSSFLRNFIDLFIMLSSLLRAGVRSARVVAARRTLPAAVRSIATASSASSTVQRASSAKIVVRKIAVPQPIRMMSQQQPGPDFEEPVTSADVDHPVRRGGKGHTEALVDENKSYQLYPRDPLTGPFGTMEAPVQVLSEYETRYVGCVGGDGDAHHELLWFELNAGRKHLCPRCGQVFALKPFKGVDPRTEE